MLAETSQHICLVTQQRLFIDVYSGLTYSNVQKIHLLCQGWPESELSLIDSS